MTQITWPITGQPMTNTQFSELMAEVGSAGVASAVGAGDLLPFRTTAGLFVPVGDAVTTRGAFYRNDADVQITVPSNGGTVTRNDLLVLRHDLVVAPEARLIYVPGGASAPVPNPLTDIPLAKCAVPSASSVPSTVIDQRLYAGLNVIPCRFVTDVPTERRRIGQPAFETTTGSYRVWDGSTWDTLQTVEDTGWIAVPSASLLNSWVPYSDAEGRARPVAYRKVNGRVTIRGVVRRFTPWTHPTGRVFNLPAGFRPGSPVDRNAGWNEGHTQITAYTAADVGGVYVTECGPRSTPVVLLGLDFFAEG